MPFRRRYKRDENDLIDDSIEKYLNDVLDILRQIDQEDGGKQGIGKTLGFLG